MKNRSQLAVGLLLVFAGAWILISRQVPDLQALRDLTMTYPNNIIAIGAAFLLVGMAVGAPSMAVPAAIIAGVGGILYYQHHFDDYASWSFMWTLIPGFAGIGELIHSLLIWDKKTALDGLHTLSVSAVLFLIFATLFGKLDILGPYTPGVILIVVGAFVLARGLKK